MAPGYDHTCEKKQSNIEVRYFTESKMNVYKWKLSLEDTFYPFLRDAIKLTLNASRCDISKYPPLKLPQELSI